MFSFRKPSASLTLPCPACDTLLSWEELSCISMKYLNRLSKRIVLAVFYILSVICCTNTERVAEECHGDKLKLSCSSGSIINVINVELGETNCYNWQCCPSAGDCTGPASQNHVNYVHSQCNGLNNCQVQAVREYIECKGRNDFERTKYRCVRKCMSKLYSIILYSIKLTFHFNHRFAYFCCS